MEALGAALCERHQMMVAAVRGMGEGDDVLGSVGQFQPQRLLVELHRAGHIRGEQQHVG
ncbi:hypothetical protein D3C80_1791690 [compost metagenome]